MTNPARQKMQMMTLTEAAAARVRDLCNLPDRPLHGLRVGVKKGGCAGMEYTVEGVSEPRAGDELVEDKGARVYIDPKAVLFLLGTQMDFKVDMMSSTFVFNNPNQTGACGCGESVMLKEANTL